MALYFYVCIPYNVLTTKNLFFVYHHTVDPLYPLCIPPLPPPSDNHYSVLYNDMFVLFGFGLFIYLGFCLFIIVFHIPDMSEIL